MYNREYTSERITSLKPNEIFVFGSNWAGSHGGGAARIAYDRFGAIWGQGVGLQGQSYAIPTMQGGVETIKPYVDEFIRFAKAHPEMKFFVTKIGCGIAAFKVEEIAPLFIDALDIVNIILPKEFVNFLNYWLNDDMANMKFKAIKIKFFDEDMKKMEGMTMKEKTEFISYLKSEHRYTVEKESPNSSWNAENDFLENYRALMERVKGGDSIAYYQVKELRAKEFRNTVEIVNQGHYVSESGKEYVFHDDSNMMCNTMFYEREIHMVDFPQCDETTIVEVQNIDCLYAGVQLKEQGYNPAVLNMASKRNPGGGVTTGAGAQEETLFRRTNLFRSLYQFAPYAEQYGIKRSHHQYPLDKNFGGVYTPDAIYFRESEQKGYALLEKPVCLSFITVAGMNRPDLTENGMIAEHHVEPIKNKIRTIFRMGLVHGHDSLVLGALGCGAFRNPPRHVARLFHEVMEEPEFKNKYRRIVFAILDDHNVHQRHNPEGNFKPFTEEFKPKKGNYMSYPNSQILWALFYEGYDDPEDYICEVVDYERVHDRNPEKTDSWEQAAREWLVSAHYEEDRMLFKQIYDMIIDLFESDIVEMFDIRLPDWEGGYDDVTVELSLNEEKVETDDSQIWIEGTVNTILDKLNVALSEIKERISY